MPLPPFPTFPRAASQFRFLDTYDVPPRLGDVVTFKARDIRGDAGNALPGVWRPINGTYDAVVGIERGCLSVSYDAIAGPDTKGAAAHMQVNGDFDAIIVLLVQPPLQFPSGNDEIWSAGVFAGIGSSSRGFAVACLDSDAPLPSSVANEAEVAVAPISINPTLAALTVAPSTGTPLVAWRSGHPLFVRVKRRAGSLRAYFSADGFTWREDNAGGSRMSGASAVNPGYIGIIVNAQMGTPAGSIKALVPTIKFLDPTTDFLA